MKNKLILLFTAFVLLCSINLFSQRTDSLPGPCFSFGIRANTFLLSDFAMREMPPARIQLNFDFAKFLRFEIQYGFSKGVRDQWYSTTGTSNFVNYPLTNKSSIYCGGLYFRKKKEKVNVYAGFRYGMVIYESDFFDSYPTPTVNTATGKITMLSGVLGGEYFLAKRFSIGGEFAFVHFKDLFTQAIPSNPNYPVVTTITNITETSIILRFYPF